MENKGYTAMYQIPCDPAQKAEAQERANEIGVSLSEFVRCAIDVALVVNLSTLPRPADAQPVPVVSGVTK
jgi:hypothetical protein